MCWLSTSPHFSTVELLKLYSTTGELVDGLFLWLTSVVMKTYINFVHSNQVWTIRLTDIVNLMDAMIVAIEGNFLVAHGLMEKVVKEVQKSEDVYNSPLDTMDRFVKHAKALN